MRVLPEADVSGIKKKGKHQKAIYRLVTAPQGGTLKYTLDLRTILHADWSNRPRTAFRRRTQAVHQVAAIQVGRHLFLACPYRLLTAKRQAKAEIFPRAISTTELPSNSSPLTFRNNQSKSCRTLRHTQPWQPTSLSDIQKKTHSARGNSLPDELET